MTPFFRVTSGGGFIGRIAWMNTDLKAPERSSNPWGETSWLPNCWWGEIGVVRLILSRP